MQEKKIQTKHQDVQIHPSLDKILPSNQQKSKLMCRICLQQSTNTHFEYDGVQSFRRPCNCKGTAQYAHEGCIIEWLNKIKEDKKKKGMHSNIFNCQICKEFINVKDMNQFKCLQSSQIQTKIKASKYKFIGQIIFMIIFIGIAGGLGFLSTIGLSRTVSILLIIFCVIIAITSLIFMKKILMQYFISWETKIIDVLSIPQVSYKKNQKFGRTMQSMQTQVRLYNQNNPQNLENNVKQNRLCRSNQQQS